MAQTSLTQFYTTKKNLRNVKKPLKSVEMQKVSEILEKDVKVDTKIISKPKPARKTKQTRAPKKVESLTVELEKKVIKPKINLKHEGNNFSDNESSDRPRTPKRNLSSPDELTPSKKKQLIDEKDKKQDHDAAFTATRKRPVARRKLAMNSQKNEDNADVQSNIEVKNSEEEKPEVEKTANANKLESLINESRSKILFSGRLGELKKSLEKFQKASSVAKEFQSNSFKITSVVSSAKKATPVEKISPKKEVPAYKKYSYLAAPESTSLILPLKYKVLCEAFRCLDVVVSMLHNRKEKITFEKVQEGVQKMMGRNFTKSHLGQIMAVLPSAYSMSYEKQSVYIVKKKGDSTDYQLVMSPNLPENSGSSKQSKINKAFVVMTPQHLSERKYMFRENILKEVKDHHQKFLKELNFPSVSDDKLLRWHPKFPLDSVPDIQVSSLPELPEMKICTAKDVLNKIKGKFKGKVSSVEKALKEVSELKTTPVSILEENSNKANTDIHQNSALKGICTDLLQKIRAKESARLIETMTRSVDAEKKTAMMERIPKIVHILWHYFIAERKAAVPVDLAVDKIIHSFNSLTTPDDVKEHLELIKEVLPGWLSFIKIPKGEYITMDTTKDLNILLSNLN